MLVWSSITYWLLSCFACAVVNNVPDRKMHLRPCQHMQWPWPLKSHFQPSLLLPSHFSCVQLWTTPSLGFSRQEHWSGLPFPSPMHKSEKWKWSLSVMSDSLRPHGLQPTRLLRPWDFPGKSTGMGCHCLLHPAFSTQCYWLETKWWCSSESPDWQETNTAILAPKGNQKHF